ncbi:MAG TPA: hypothetical protein PKD31_20200, partial [Blastocatellia bacterium]|nr:hypothetical protein [Blastocatellia bacterium]
MPVIKHRRAIIFALIFGILMLSSLARSQEKKQDPPKKEEEMATIRLDTDLVTLEVAVTDRDGKRSNTGLRAEDFVIYEDGVRQKVASFQTADVPFNLVLLMDTSGSTRDDVGLMRRAAL